VLRSRLLKRLEEGQTGKLTLIVAPAGFGKTTLIANWLHDFGFSILDFGLHQPQTNRKSKIENPKCAWLSLDDGDNDLSTFLRYVIAALRTIIPDVGVRTLMLLQSSPPAPVASIITPLVNDLAGGYTDDDHTSGVPPVAALQRIVLVLDDYHLIRDPSIHEAMTFLLDHMPPRLHLVIVGREEPPLPLARLRARNEMAELRAADLRFTTNEAADFLTNTMRLPLTAPEITALEQRTEGWIAGLQLAALAMRDRDDHASFIASFSGSNRLVMEYLAAEALLRQPPHIQAFLLQTSVLERMCGALCDSVLARTKNQEPRTGVHLGIIGSQFLGLSSQSILDHLDRSNLFLVLLDDEQRWYRYHHLFAEMLRKRLTAEATPEAIAALHLRASVWFEEQQLFEEATRHALAAKAFDEASRLIERNIAALFNDYSMYYKVTTWLAAIPADLKRNRPMLCIIQAWLNIHTINLKVAEIHLLDAEHALQNSSLPQEERANMHGMVMTAKAMVAAMSYRQDDVIGYAQQALDLLDRTETLMRGMAALSMTYVQVLQGQIEQALQVYTQIIDLSDPNISPQFVLVVKSHQSFLERAIGEQRRAWETCRQSMEWAEQRNASGWTSMNGVWLSAADLLREANDLDAALQYAQLGVERGMEWGPLPHLFGLIVLARIQWARGDLETALTTAQEGLSLAHRSELTLFEPQLYALAAQISIIQNQLDKAQALLQLPSDNTRVNGLSAPFILVYAYEHDQIAPTQLLLAQGRATGDQALLNAALSNLETLLQTAEREQLPWLGAKALALTALAHHALGDTDQALEALERALSQAMPREYIRLFVDEGAPMRLLIADCRLQIEQHSIPQIASYVERLFVAFGDRETGRPGDRETGRPGDRETGRPGDRETGRWGGAESNLQSPISNLQSPISNLQSQPIEPLSARELDVLQLMVTGQTNQQIAEALTIGVGTVKTHLKNIYGKLGVHNRVEAIAHARELHII
jgi:LuxR family maltose regulon positive regulatory protein